MTGRADLHTHTYFSDGSESPAAVVAAAKDAGLRALAITDHDNVDAYPEALDAAQAAGVELIPGVELSTRVGRRSVDMLGYCFDPLHPRLNETLTRLRASRQERMKEMIARLEQMGVRGIEFSEVAALSESDAVGRPHLAQVLVTRGVVPSMAHAFHKYIGDDGPAFVPKATFSPAEAIELLHTCGGAAVMAHPMITQKDEIISGLVKAGLDGIEVYYANALEKAIGFYERLAKKHGLIATGGSDAHGRFKRHTWVGKAGVDYDVVEALKARAGSAN